MPEFVTFTDYYTGAPVAVRTAYLAAKAVHAAHVDGCFPCSQERAIERRAAGETGRLAWGPSYKRLSFEGYPFDLFTPEAARFGLILTIRTGPAAWSHQLVTPRGTKTRDGRDGLMPPYLRVREGWLTERTSGRRIPTPTERDVFDHMQLRWLEPEDRT